ncbi:MAG: hypothetical protein ACFCVF_08760 [Kineosporiaceae bacterium]
MLVQVPPAAPFPPELAGRPALMINVMVDGDAGLRAWTGSAPSCQPSPTP